MEDFSSKHFNQIVALHEAPEMEWSTLSQMIPSLPRGWFELSRLPVEDRIEFTREFWQVRLPFVDDEGILLEKRLNEFFDNLEEIGIFATQSKNKAPFEVHMVYSMKGDAGFLQGFPPATEDVLAVLQKRFAHIHFPPDYLAFLGIHDGFSKYTDTGLIKSRDMVQIYQRLQHLLAKEMLVRPDGKIIDPQQLIPFYESFGLHNYQCFYAEWHPKHGMGNLYFSEHERSVSNFLDPDHAVDNLAFPSFLGWLIFYLEDMWHIEGTL